MTPITKIEDVMVWLGPGHDQVIVNDAYLGAEAWVGSRVTWDDSQPAPDDLVLAVDLQTQRLLARRNSPDGLVGMGDLGMARVPVSDSDIASLIAPWRFQVIA